MSEIWKFPLEAFDQEVRVPLGAKVVHVGHQDGVPTIWVVVDPTQQKQVRRFCTVGTGQMLPEGAAYHGTVPMPNGLVWHVLEVKPS
jgi:hypothetical protein